MDTPSAPKLYTLDEYFALPGAPDAWIIEDILPASGRLLFYAQPKFGKSYCALQLAAAVGDPAATDFLGLPIHSHGPVAYIQIDTPRGLWRERIHDHFLAQGFTFKNVLFCDRQITPFPFNILLEGHQWLRAVCDEHRPVLVILDTIRETHMGDENDSGHMKNVLSLITAAIGDAALMLISHDRKNQNDGGDNLFAGHRGSTYIVGAADVVMRGKNPTTLEYQGRATGLEAISVARDPLHYTFKLQDPIRSVVERAVRTNPGVPQLELAKLLSKDFPEMGIEALRSKIRRAVEARSGGGKLH